MNLLHPSSLWITRTWSQVPLLHLLPLTTLHGVTIQVAKTAWHLIRTLKFDEEIPVSNLLLYFLRAAVNYFYIDLLLTNYCKIISLSATCFGYNHSATIMEHTYSDNKQRMTNRWMVHYFYMYYGTHHYMLKIYAKIYILQIVLIC
jgi:hypothetical protein